MPTHKELDPLDIALFCLKAVMHIPEAFANLVQQPGCNQGRTIRFAVRWGVGIAEHKHSIARKTPKIKIHSDSDECDKRRRDRAKGRICCVLGIAKSLFNRQRWKTGYKSTTCRIRFSHHQVGAAIRREIDFDITLYFSRNSDAYFGHHGSRRSDQRMCHAR